MRHWEKLDPRSSRMLHLALPISRCDGRLAQISGVRFPVGSVQLPS